MRIQPTTKHFTKAERRFVRILQELHIPFKAKVKIKNREIDFIIGNYAIEIDGHPQDSSKNWMILEEGLHPIHFENKDISQKSKQIIKQWLVHR